MPDPVQNCLFAAALLAITLAGSPLRAETTEADRTGQRDFAGCLVEAGGDEKTCIGKLGRIAWYPHDEAVCEAVGAQVEKVIELDGLPKWRHIYMNERCARMGLPHGAKGATVGARVDPNNPLARCVNAGPWKNFCLDTYGRQGWYPFRDNVCPFNTRGLARQTRDGEKQVWSMLFYNERCRRLSMDYFEAPQ